MKKHAYLILAHNEFKVLQKLLDALDDERNDLFIHFDAKLQSVPKFAVHRSKLYVIPQRVKVYWADFSMVQAELNLLEVAMHTDEYAYFHYLSGVDMPLKSSGEIHQFFHTHQGKEFIDICLYDVESEMVRKMHYWHLFPKDFKNISRFRIFTQVIRALFLRLQMLVGFKRNRNVEFKKGSQWCSISADFGRYLLHHRPVITRMFTHTFCPDEVMIQTLCWNSHFRERLFDCSLAYKGHMRMIDWGRGRPYVWKEEDWEELQASDRLFARKFSEKSIEIVDRILRNLKNREDEE